MDSIKKTQYGFNRWRFVSLLLLLLVLGLYIIRLSEPEQKHLSETHEVLNRGLVGEPESLDPHNFSSNQASTILRDIGEGLLTYSADGSLVGGVAKSWVISDDGIEYRFVLRPNAKWSNGESIKADDFVAAFRKLVNPQHAASNAHFIQQISRAREILVGEADVEELEVFAISSSQLEIRLHSPSPFFIQLLTHPSTYPIPGGGSPSTRGNSIRDVSNGAYVLSKRIIGSEIIVKRNLNYWNRDNVAFDTVVYHIVQEAAELNRFRAGELDITANVSPGNFSVARNEFPDQLRVAPYAGVYYYGFNVENSIFANKPDLRKALSLAIDREVLVKKITGRGESPAFGWVPRGVSNYSPQSMDDLGMRKEAREQLARHLYKKSGFGPNNSLKFQLRYNVSDVQQRIALAAQAMWREVLGAQAELVAEEFRVLLANIAEKNSTEVFRSSWTADYDDAQSFLQLFETGNPSNLTGYSNFIFDEMMLQASRESNLFERRALLERAEQLVLESHVVIPMYFYVSKHLVSDRIKGWSGNVLDIHPSQYLRPSSK